MKSTIYKTYYILSAPFVKGNWAKVFMSLEEIERKKNEAMSRVFVRIEPLSDAKPRHIKASLTKLLGRKCKFVSDHINGVVIHDFFFDYGKDIGYISTRLGGFGYIKVALVGGLSGEILELFEKKEFMTLPGLNIRPSHSGYSPLGKYNKVVRSAYESMMQSTETKPKTCPACPGDCDGDYWIRADWICGECNHQLEGRPERLPEDDISGMLDALEAHRIEHNKVFLETSSNA